MSFWSRWFETTPDMGDALEGPQCWTVDTCRDAAMAFRALPPLFDDESFMVLEGTTEREFAEYLSQHAESQPFKVARGTIWPKSDFYHVPLRFAEGLATVIERDSIALPSCHFHVHDGQRVLLEWYDSFTDVPMYIVDTIEQKEVEAFALSIGVAPPRLGPKP